MYKQVQILLLLYVFFSRLVYAGQDVAQLTLNVPTGKTQFSIQLASNPTTGYKWFILNYDKQLQLTSHVYLPPQNNRIGAGGNEIWNFKILNLPLQKTVIHFQYARPWNRQDNPSYLDYIITSN